jgi:hypothetical protein
VGFVDPCLFVPLTGVPRSSFFWFDFISSMAYNREWDMGKESWHDGGSWGVGPGKGRDDDFGEGKKRKFNNAVCNPGFHPPWLTCSSSRPGTIAVMTLITVIRTMGLVEAVSTATRNASLLATPVHTSFFLGLT